MSVHPNNEPSRLILSAVMGMGIAFAFCLFMVVSVSLIETADRDEQIADLNQTLRATQVENMEHRSNIAGLQYRLNITSPDVQWLARALYSETNRVYEMYYVAWVIRNRVEANYRGKDTYREVVLDPYQFSAFNANRTSGRYTRAYYMSRDLSDTSRLWQEALRVAYEVIHHDVEANPFPEHTYYFYSEISMPAHRPHPHWASAFQQVEVEDVDEYRFRFFRNPNYRGGNQSPARPIGSANTSAR